MKLQFSGHDSFICKHFWLKKGYDLIQHGNYRFNDEQAIIELGVGKNMVTAISYWLKCYGITDNSNKITELGDYLFNERIGKDPFLENLGSIWLLHYSLLKTNKASIYNLFFNEFRRERIEFTKEHLIKFLLKKVEEDNGVNINTINTDISVFIRNYAHIENKHKKIDIEEDFASLMLDLDLMYTYLSENSEGKDVEWYKVPNSLKVDLPYQIVLFSILDNETYGNSISFNELLLGDNSPGRLFCLTEDGLYNKIESIIINYKDITYRDTAGVKELQFRHELNKWRVLNEYYKN